MIALTLALLGVVAIATKWRTTALARFEEEGLQFVEEGIPTFRLANWLSFPISEPFGSRLCQDGSSERKSPGSAEWESGPISWVQHWVQLGPVLGSFFGVKRCRINE
jgi:hypothetical protein